MSALAALRPRSPAAQRGVGLVEMMVAMVLGAMVVLGVVQIFTANKQTFRMQDAMALTQETGTFAVDFIARDLLRAGFPGAPISSDAFDLAATSGTGNTNDVLAVVYGPDVAQDVFCTGESVGGALRISNRYWVNADRQLVCQGAVQDGAGVYQLTGSPQVLVDNVERFQVMFGVDLEFDRDPLQGFAAAVCPESLAQPTAYVRPALLAAAIARGAAPPVCKLPMEELEVVRTVRIALLLRTPDKVNAIVSATKHYTTLDQSIDDPEDGYLRRLFTKTVSLRNVEEVLE